MLEVGRLAAKEELLTATKHGEKKQVTYHLTSTRSHSQTNFGVPNLPNKNTKKKTQ